jgi:hypothetical protein
VAATHARAGPWSLGFDGRAHVTPCGLKNNCGILDSYSFNVGKYFDAGFGDVLGRCEAFTEKRVCDVICD